MTELRARIRYLHVTVIMLIISIPKRYVYNVHWHKWKLTLYMRYQKNKEYEVTFI